MNNNMNPVIITEHDFQQIKSLINTGNSNRNERLLSNEMNRAILVKKDAFPINTVGLNCMVTVLNVATRQKKTFSIVMPEAADAQRNRISILSPMGTALIGFRKGEEVVWEMPGGLKKFIIIDVIQAF